MTTPTISILMPARNCEKYIADAIDSLIGQTFSDWELIVADDGSTDSTRDIIDRYDDPRIHRAHNDTRLGVVHTRNKLLSFARGDLVTWLDADDISYNVRLERLVEVFNQAPELDLCGSNASRRYKFSGELFVTNYPLTHDQIRQTIEQRRIVPFSGPSVAFRREILKNIPNYRPFFNRGGGDPDFLLRVSEQYQVGNVSDVLYEYRYTRNSTSRTFTEDYYYRPYLQDIIFFLADQRAQYAGVDGLMDGGNNQEFLEFMETLRRRFERDRSIIYRKACQNKINNQDYTFAFLDAVQAVQANPLKFNNYLLFPQTLGSLIKVLFRVAKQRNRPKCSIISSEH